MAWKKFFSETNKIATIIRLQPAAAGMSVCEFGD
jgi:hypothetical protein